MCECARTTRRERFRSEPVGVALAEGGELVLSPAHGVRTVGRVGRNGLVPIRLAIEKQLATTNDKTSIPAGNLTSLLAIRTHIYCAHSRRALRATARPWPQAQPAFTATAADPLRRQHRCCCPARHRGMTHGPGRGFPRPGGCRAPPSPCRCTKRRTSRRSSCPFGA